MFGRATITLGIGPHSSVKVCFILKFILSALRRALLRCVDGAGNTTEENSCHLLPNLCKLNALVALRKGM